MVVRYIVGNLLDGRKIQNLQAIEGSWSEVLNDAGELECTVPLSDPVNRNLGLRESATVGKAFLAAIDGDTVLQAGPIWQHVYSGPTDRLTLRASGMWGYFDHRALLPVLDPGQLPTDPATDTRYSNIISDENDPGYPWATDTRASLTTIAKQLVEQAQSWTNGDVPVVLPDEVAGDSERWYKGTDLATVGERLRQLTAVDGGPDIMFTPRWQTDKLGVEWVMRVGTPDEPLLSSAQEQKFQVGVAASSVSGLSVQVDGTGLASQGFASGGRTVSQAIIAVASDSTLLDAGYPALDGVDASHQSASEEETVQAFADEVVLRGARPAEVWSFSHETTQRPYLGAFNAGDYAEVSVRDNSYLEDGSYRMRILSRSGKFTSTKVDLKFSPVVV